MTPSSNPNEFQAHMDRSGIWIQASPSFFLTLMFILGALAGGAIGLVGAGEIAVLFYGHHFGWPAIITAAVCLCVVVSVSFGFLLDSLQQPVTNS